MSDVYKENYDLKKQVEAMKQGFCDIANEITRIGGPLNDNTLWYTTKQLQIFQRILAKTGDWE